MTRCALPKTPRRRVSPDSAWPIRRADGLTPAQVRPLYRPAVRRLEPMTEQRGIFEGLFAKLLLKGRGK